MKFVTIIPARGGSKRFPRKNITELAGQPLIAHSIQYSLNNKKITATFVSTDSLDIKRVSEEYGAVVLNRPDELSGDYTSTAEVMQYAVKQLLDLNYDFDFVVLLQATNPLRPDGMLEKAIEIIESGDYDSLMTMNRSTRKLGKIIDGKFTPWNYTFGMRSQDLDPLYYENGLLYITSKEQLLKGNIMGENMYPMVIDHIFGEVDIDTEDDMSYAEFVYSKYH
jgi:N-acylneuraminate cytidylyltransferase